MLIFLFLGFFLQTRSQENAGLWLDVPYVKQSEDGCGSAVISMLLQYWTAHGTTVDPQRADAGAIQSRVYSRKARGVFASDMEEYLKSSGFRVFPLSGEWKDLEEQLKRGRPLVVSLQPGSAKSPLHYVVIVGFDSRQEAVFINDPARGKLLRVARTQFELQWRPSRNWMLLVVPEKAA